MWTAAMSSSGVGRSREEEEVLSWDYFQSFPSAANAAAGETAKKREAIAEGRHVSTKWHTKRILKCIYTLNAR